MGMDKRGSFCLKDCGQAQVAYNTRAGVENWEGEVSAGGNQARDYSCRNLFPIIIASENIYFLCNLFMAL